LCCPHFQLPTVAKLNNNTLDFSSFNKEINIAYSEWKQIKHLDVRKKKRINSGQNILRLISEKSFTLTAKVNKYYALIITLTVSGVLKGAHNTLTTGYFGTAFKRVNSDPDSKVFIQTSAVYCA
jgi:hypothetical protein